MTESTTTHRVDFEIPMNGWSEDKLYKGQKTATTRTTRYGDPGDRFEAVGNIYALTHVVKVPLEVVADHFWEEEGCEDRAEFLEVWNDIHYRRGYESDWEVWLHLFRKVKMDD